MDLRRGAHLNIMAEGFTYGRVSVPTSVLAGLVLPMRTHIYTHTQQPSAKGRFINAETDRHLTVEA